MLSQRSQLGAAPRPASAHAALRRPSAAPAAAARARRDVSAMAAKIIDGKQIAEDIRKEIAVEVAALKAATGKVPGLAVVLVGARKDSETYVRNKKKACAEVGFESFGTGAPPKKTGGGAPPLFLLAAAAPFSAAVLSLPPLHAPRAAAESPHPDKSSKTLLGAHARADLPEDASEEEVLRVVAAYNADPAVHGILVQLPLPKHIAENRILDAIDIEKARGARRAARRAFAAAGGGGRRRCGRRRLP